MAIAITGMRGLLLAAAATACVWATKGYAQTDVDAVKAAVAAYNQAVDSLDAAKMEALWLQDDTVVDIEPRSKSIGLGWEAVKKNLEQNFSPFAELKDTQVDGPHVQIKGNVALSTGMVEASVKLKDGKTGAGRVFETQVFEKRDGRWLLVSHSATTVSQ